MTAPGLTYRDAGIDLAASDRYKDRLVALVARTLGPQVVPNPGGFAGYYALQGAGQLFAKRMREPLLVATNDGVGTKVLLAAELETFHTVGLDLVAMSVNDLIVCGAEPLFFLDYIAVGRLDEARELRLIEGIVEGCRDAGCALLGGETAEMPDVYRPDHFDMAGFAVGIVDRPRLLDGRHVRPGDRLVALASSGVHSNGYSLVRKILARAKLDLRQTYPELGAERLGDILLRPTRIYARPVLKTLRAHRVQRLIRAMANVTGSGIPGNLPRVLPKGVRARIRRDACRTPPIFRFLQAQGRVPEDEMWNVFNMGVGFVMVVAPQAASAVCRRLNRLHEEAFVVGEIVAGEPGAEPVVDLV